MKLLWNLKICVAAGLSLFSGLFFFAAVSNAATQSKISVMTYNMENLFDTVHDENRVDFTYLPLAEKSAPEVQAYCHTQAGNRKKECLTLDWSPKVLNEKMKRLADTIYQVGETGPDILIVEEVENLRVLTDFNKRFLQKSNYQTVSLIEGEDGRGIDNGVLSRFPLAGPARLHLIDFSGMSDTGTEKPKTRGIMEVPLKLENGETLTVYALHFPSQANPLSWRQAATQSLLKILARHKPSDLFVVGGDFNITKSEEEQTGLFSKVIGNEVAVSHLVGCQNCGGTQYFDKTWSFLDALLFPKALLDPNAKQRLLIDSIQTRKVGQYQLDGAGRPVHFPAANPTQKIGVSDHIPMYAEILIKN